MAVGARSSDILQQFLVEAIVLSSTGGVLGLVVGLAGAAVAGFALHVPFTVPPLVPVLAFGFSVAVGVVFGVFPARRAARLRPIEALRFE
jgi:putative ABC transport system permease protein